MQYVCIRVCIDLTAEKTYIHNISSTVLLFVGNRMQFNFMLVDNFLNRYFFF